MPRDVVVRTVEGERFRNGMTVGPHALAADEGAEVGGGDAGPAPFELLMAALGACTSMTIRMYAEKKGWKVEGVQVDLSHEALDVKEGPRVRLRRDIRIRGALDAEQRRRLLEIAERCPVHRVLTEGVVMATREVE